MLAEIAFAVRSGKVSAVEIVEESLRRIEKLDGDLNSVVSLRADEALAEAAEQRIDGTLAGVPLLVKDLEDVKGMRTTFGSKLHADAPTATEDDIICARLQAAGAIVIGKTNTPEFAFMGYTNNLLFGATRNPWNLEKSPGGSSGGAGAALMGGLSPLATSSDGGGSVRIPASLSGLVGYKPTFGAYPRSRTPAWMTFSMNGTLGRSIDDVVLEAAAVVGWVPGDMHGNGHPPPLDPVRPAKVIATPSFKEFVDAPIRDAFERTCAVISSDIGLPLETADKVFDTDPSPAINWLVIAAAELAESLNPFEDREGEMDPGLQLALAMGKNVTTIDYIRAQRLRYAASVQLDDLLGNDTVLVVPTANALAWPATGPMPTNIDGHDVSPVDGTNTMEINYTGHPAVSVPMGLDPNGVPMGFQIIAPRHRDDLALGLAADLEAAQPWPTVADGYEPFPVPEV